MKNKIKKIFEEILESEIIYFSFSEESLFPEITGETKKILKVEYREKKEERKITEKQLNLLRRILERGNNKNKLKEKFNLNYEEINKLSFDKAKEILNYFLEVKNA